MTILIAAGKEPHKYESTPQNHVLAKKKKPHSTQWEAALSFTESICRFNSSFHQWTEAKPLKAQLRSQFTGDEIWMVYTAVLEI